MSKLVSVSLILLVWASSPVAAVASVQSPAVPGKWPGGRITWYYNPAGRPADVGDDEVIAGVTAAFSAWQRVCQVEGVYAGITSIPVDPRPPTTYVVGWADLTAAASNTLSMAGGTSTYAPFTGGTMTIGSASPVLRSGLDNGDFVGVMQHEIGHAFGLAHSDDPTSIMFSGPEGGNSHTYMRTLQGDDIAACADLYGGRGLAAKEDLRNAAPEPGFAVQLNVLAAPPTSAIPTGSLTQIDPVGGGPYYFAYHYQRLRAGASLEARWVAPNGTVDRRTTTTSGTGTSFQFSTLPGGSTRFQFAGRWAFQLLVDGRLAANVPFEVVRGSVATVQPFEAAMIGEANASGILSWRIAPYGNGGITRIGIIANNQAIAVTGLRAPPGDNVAEVWAETDRPRYTTTGGRQPASSFDVMRQVRFTAGADGLPAAALHVSETGTPDAYSAVATVAATGTGPHGVYVAAVLGGRVYFRQASGWSDRPEPLVTVQAPAVASVDLVRNLDIREVPAGSALYVGYGRSVGDVLARGLYALVRQFAAGPVLPPPPLPGLSLVVNRTGFRPGETMTVTATLTPDTSAIVSLLVDAYVVVRLPDGSFLSLTGAGIAPGIAPIATGLVPVPFSGQLLSYTFTGGEPSGSYTWMAGLTQAGTGNVIGTVDQHQFTFSR